MGKKLSKCTCSYVYNYLHLSTSKLAQRLSAPLLDITAEGECSESKRKPYTPKIHVPLGLRLRLNNYTTINPIHVLNIDFLRTLYLVFICLCANKFRAKSWLLVSISKQPIGYNISSRILGVQEAFTRNFTRSASNSSDSSATIHF